MALLGRVDHRHVCPCLAPPKAPATKPASAPPNAGTAAGSGDGGTDAAGNHGNGSTREFSTHDNMATRLSDRCESASLVQRDEPGSVRSNRQLDRWMSERLRLGQGVLDEILSDASVLGVGHDCDDQFRRS